MGYMRHHAIVVTGYDTSSIKAAHKKAVKIFPWVSPISPKVINGYTSFFIPPDGSKEGWDESEKGDIQRDQFVEYLEKMEFLGWVLGWVEVQYDDDDYETKATRSSDALRKAEREEDK